MACPEVEFELRHNGRRMLRARAREDRIQDLFPKTVAESSGLDPFQWTVEGCRRGGFRAADRLPTRLPGVFQEPGPHDRHTVGRRGQTYSMRGRQDGVSPRTKPAGGDHDQDRCFTYDVAEHLRTPEGGDFSMTAIGENWVTLDSTELRSGSGFSRARLPGSAGFQPAMGRRRTMIHAGFQPAIPGRRWPQPELCAQSGTWKPAWRRPMATLGSLPRRWATSPAPKGMSQVACDAGPLP